MAEVLGLGALLSDSPDIAKIEDEISKIRYAKTAEPDHAADFYKKMSDITASSGIDLGQLMPSKPPPKESKQSLPHKNKHGPMIDFMPDSSSKPKRRNSVDSVSSMSVSSAGSAEIMSKIPSIRRQPVDTMSDTVSESDDSGSDDESDGSYEQPGIHNLNEALRDMDYGASTKNIDKRSSFAVEQMIEEIDILKLALTDLKVDTSSIPDLKKNMHPSEVRRVHKLMLHLFSQQQYINVFEDALIIGATAVESVFDGSRQILGKFKLDYTGLANSYAYRLKSNPVGVKHMVSSVAKEYGFSPTALTAAQLFLPLIGTPLKNMNNEEVINNRHTQQSLGNIK